MRPIPFHALPFALALTVAPALGAGVPSVPTEAATPCEAGEVHPGREACVAEDASSMADRLETGRALALAGRYEDAIAVLETADAGDADVRNMLGFAHRKAGRMAEGMAHYEAALAIDPDHAPTRSSMGQSMLEAGNREGAMEQLRLIRAATGPVSLEYVMLRDALAGGADAY